VNSRKTWNNIKLNEEQVNGRRINTEMSNQSSNKDLDLEVSRSKNLYIEESEDESSKASSSGHQN